MATRAPLDFRQHLEVETPEHVVLDYEIAGLGSRALAAIIDTLILIGWSMALLVGLRAPVVSVRGLGRGDLHPGVFHISLGLFRLLRGAS